MRWIAAGFVILGCGYLGISFAGAMEIRIRQLELLEQMLRQLEFNMVFLAQPFSEGLEMVASSYKGVTGRLFSQVAMRMKKRPGMSPESAFQMSLDEVEGIRLKQEEQQVLLEFFRHVGGGDRETVRDGIRMTMAKIRTIRESAMEEQKKDGKLWRSMGFLSGVFVVLLLL